MATSIEDIIIEMDTEQALQPDLATLNSPSQSAIYTLWKYITAVVINLHEQLWDIFKLEIEAIAASAVPGTPSWIRKMALYFQYDAVTPQVIELNTTTLAPEYPTVDPLLNIITQCAIKEAPNHLVKVKVAKGVVGSLAPLSGAELIAFEEYLTVIKFAGIQMDAISLLPDRLQVDATIYYDGQYTAALVKANVITAITNYCYNLGFDSFVRINGGNTNPGLVDAIQAVQGVVDVVLLDVLARDEATPHGSSGVVTVTQDYETVAGYIIPEDTALFTLNDTLTMSL